MDSAIEFFIIFFPSFQSFYNLSVSFAVHVSCVGYKLEFTWFLCAKTGLNHLMFVMYYQVCVSK